jgi:hypothetical protein
LKEVHGLQDDSLSFIHKPHLYLLSDETLFMKSRSQLERRKRIMNAKRTKVD